MKIFCLFAFSCLASIQASAQVVAKIKGTEALVYNSANFETGQTVYLKDESGMVVASGIIKAKKNDRSIVSVYSGEAKVGLSVSSDSSSDFSGTSTKSAQSESVPPGGLSEESAVTTPKRKTRMVSSEENDSTETLSMRRPTRRFLSTAGRGLYLESGTQHSTVTFAQNRVVNLDGTATGVHGYLDFSWNDSSNFRADLGLISESVEGTASAASCSDTFHCNYKSQSLAAGLFWHFNIYQSKTFKYGVEAGGHLETPLSLTTNLSSSQGTSLNLFTDVSLSAEVMLSAKTSVPFGLRFVNCLNPASDISSYRLGGFLGYGVVF